MPRRGRCRFVAFLRPCLGLFLAALVLACDDSERVSKELVQARASSLQSAAHGSAAATSATPAQSGPATPKSDRVAQGHDLYQRYCALCHGKTGEGYIADNAPSLITQTFLESVTDGFLQRAIRVGRPDTAMAAYGRQRGGPLSEADIRAIVAYIRSLGPQYKPLHAYQVRGEPQRGELLYATHCMKCHGDESIRGTALSLHNPEFLASATPAFLKHAIMNGRAPTPMPAFRGQLSDGQVDDIIAWLKGLTPPEPVSPPVRRPEVPKDLPLVIHPKGKAPTFKLRANRFVSAEQVKDALAQQRRMVIVDARSGADWIQYHIPGSVPIGYYETERLTEIPNDGTWVVAYCACPHHASGMVVDALRRKGYKNTAILDEGILEWKKRGYPLDGEAMEPKPPPPGTSP